ncbi:hypothetical protein CDL12_16109 [Handroanthus impetiginosus]|uniref:Uncharacterized protein n=1 Tax=Handroanthus impetiginosus TaxID=429701 RepID=A0A2G9H192_9LAMI|nr:hypothetical protein CDL12_16109 [Handroanthus impetiginosus]
MYRSKKTVDDNLNSQGLADQRFFMEGVDGNMYKLNQLPLLPSFIQRHHSNFRYGDASWINGNGKWMHNYNKTEPGIFYGSLAERTLGSHYYKSANPDPCSRIPSSIEDLKVEFGSLNKQEHSRILSKQNPNIDQLQPRSELSRSNLGSKRKASDCELDLNLSLGFEYPRNYDHEEKGILQEAENLSLSLHTISSCSKKVKEDVVVSGKSERGASTLDLTL